MNIYYYENMNFINLDWAIRYRYEVLEMIDSILYIFNDINPENSNDMKLTRLNIEKEILYLKQEYKDATGYEYNN